MHHQERGLEKFTISRDAGLKLVMGLSRRRQHRSGGWRKV